MSASTAASLWADEGEAIAPGVHRLPVVLPEEGLRAVNVYVLSDAEGVDLVDCGMDDRDSEEALVAGLAGLGVGLDDVRNVFVTHHHVDHYSLATVLRRRHGFTLHLGAGEEQNLRAVQHVAATRGERSYVADMRRVGFPADISALATAGLSELDAEVWVDPDAWVADGARLASRSRELTAIATPGHTQGHLVFRDDRAGMLFTGDHVLSRITPSIGFEAKGRPRSALGDFLDSLTLLLDLPDSRLLPAHGPVQDSVHARTRELLAHHEERLSGTLTALGRVEDPATPYDVARLLTWTRRERSIDELEPFNQYLAAAETAAHLDVLVAQDLAHRTDTGEPDRYAAGPTPAAPAHEHEHEHEEDDHESLGD